MCPQVLDSWGASRWCRCIGSKLIFRDVDSWCYVGCYVGAHLRWRKKLCYLLGQPKLPLGLLISKPSLEQCWSFTGGAVRLLDTQVLLLLFPTYLLQLERMPPMQPKSRELKEFQHAGALIAFGYAYLLRSSDLNMFFSGKDLFEALPALVILCSRLEVTWSNQVPA